MSLACKDQLYATFGLRQNSRKPMGLLEQKCRPLVCCKTSGETYRERFGVKDLFSRLQMLGGRASGLKLSNQPSSGKVHQPCATPFVGAPQLGVRNFFYALPYLFIIRVLGPPRPQIPIV